MKRLISFVLSIFIVSTVHILCYAQDTNQYIPFTDVDENNLHYDAIMYLKDKGVIQGYEDGTFKPNIKINRAETLKILLLGSKKQITEGGQLPFPDTGSGSWYAPYIVTGMQLGIVQGYPDGTFHPEQTVNKVESLKMLLRTNEVPLSSVRLSLPFDDIPLSTPASWFEPYVVYGLAKNIIEPATIKTFEPQKEMTRGDIAQMMYRLSVIQENQSDRFSSEQRGAASFYGNVFEGRKTASGQSFSNNAFVAAHRSLPFNTFLQVINTNTGVGAVVKVIDRGPYIDGRILDLSQSAFSAIENLSRGVVSIVSTPIGIIPETNKAFIATDAFLDTNTNQMGVVLDAKYPNLFLRNEVYLFTGRTVTNAETITALVTLKGTKKQRVFQGDVIEHRFSLPVSFEEEGSYTLNFIPDETGIGYENVSVLSDVYFSSLKYIPNVNTVLSPKAIFSNGKTVFSWDKNGNNLFRIHISQGDREQLWYVNNSNQFEIPYDDFSQFKEEEVQWYVEGARSSTGFSIDRYTEWAKSPVLSFAAVTHDYEVYKTDKVILSPFSPFISGTTISMAGTAKTTLKPDVWYTEPSGKTKSLSVSSSPTISTGESFSFDIPVVETGTYIVEINDIYGEAVLNVPFYAPDTLPFLPNMRDQEKNLSMLTTFSRTVEQEKMLQSINTVRTTLGLAPFVLKDYLNNLAQARSDDMATRNYFSHTTPEGKTVTDMTDEYHITGSIGENLAKDNNPVLGLYGLLRSPVHRNLLISSHFTSIGIGLSKATDGQIIVTQIVSQ